MAALDLPPGWLADDEAVQLAELARGKKVLELGAWKGRSTVLLSSVADHVVSVDRHLGIEGHGESLFEYLEEVRPLANVTIVIGLFEHVVPLLGNFDLAYIDGDHEASDVERDSLLARKHADMLAFHDWDFESVRAGASHLGRPQGVVGSLAWFNLRRDR